MGGAVSCASPSATTDTVATSGGRQDTEPRRSEAVEAPSRRIPDGSSRRIAGGSSRRIVPSARRVGPPALLDSNLDLREDSREDMPTPSSSRPPRPNAVAITPARDDTGSSNTSNKVEKMTVTTPDTRKNGDFQLKVTDTPDARRNGDFQSKVAGTPFGADAKNYPYYCPICMCYFQRVLKTACCGHYCCLGCTRDYLSTRHLGTIDTVDDVLKLTVLLDEIPCVHCAGKGCQFVEVVSSETIRDYAASITAVAATKPNSDKSATSIHPSPVRVGESFEDLKRKMVPFQTYLAPTAEAVETEAPTSPETPMCGQKSDDLITSPLSVIDGVDDHLGLHLSPMSIDGRVEELCSVDSKAATLRLGDGVANSQWNASNNGIFSPGEVNAELSEPIREDDDMDRLASSLGIHTLRREPSDISNTNFPEDVDRLAVDSAVMTARDGGTPQSSQIELEPVQDVEPTSTFGIATVEV